MSTEKAHLYCRYKGNGTQSPSYMLHVAAFAITFTTVPKMAVLHSVQSTGHATLTGRMYNDAIMHLVPDFHVP